MLFLHQVDVMTAADRTGFLVAQAMGAEDVVLPSVEERREAFVTALSEPAKELTAAQRLLQQWGVK